MQLIERFRKRLIASGVLAFLIAFCTVSGTIAYLQDSTDNIENVFTAGSVAISLTESVVSDDGVPVLPASRTSSGQTYKLVPSHSYIKDPIVTVEANSEPCYVYLLVDNPITAIEDSTAGTIASQISAAGWSTLTASSGNLYCNSHALTSTQTLYYKSVSASSSDQDLSTFTSLNIDLWADTADIEAAANTSLNVTAFAVQQDNFASAIDAWEATYGERYDPTVDYDFGTVLKSGQTASSRGSGVYINKVLGGSSCRFEFKFHKTTGASGNNNPIFISDYICLTGDSTSRVWLGVKKSSATGTVGGYTELGSNWSWIRIGGSDTSYTVIAEGPNVWVNGTLKVSDALCEGWGDYEPQIFGQNISSGTWTSGSFYYVKFYTDGDLVLDLVPAREKSTQYVGLFDYIENVFYKATGDLKFYLTGT